jgi:hypothetical protein
VILGAFFVDAMTKVVSQCRPGLSDSSIARSKSGAKGTEKCTMHSSFSSVIPMAYHCNLIDNLEDQVYVYA